MQVRFNLLFFLFFEISAFIIAFQLRALISWFLICAFLIIFGVVGLHLTKNLSSKDFKYGLIGTLLFLVLGLLFPKFALAGPDGAGGGATEVTQLANNTQLALSYVEQANQTITQLNQYKTMLQNLKKMSPGVLSGPAMQKIWKDANMDSTFRDLYRLTSNGQRLSYSLQNMDQQFRMLHPGYGNYSTFDYQTAYRNWSDNSRNATLAALRVSAINAEDIQSEGDLVDELRLKSETSEGQLQALQAGNQIGLSLVNQIQKLRQLQLAQIQAQQTTAFSDRGRRDADEDLMHRALSGSCDRILSPAEVARGLSCKK